MLFLFCRNMLLMWLVITTSFWDPSKHFHFINKVLKHWSYERAEKYPLLVDQMIIKLLNTREMKRCSLNQPWYLVEEIELFKGYGFQSSTSPLWSPKRKTRLHNHCYQFIVHPALLCFLFYEFYSNQFFHSILTFFMLS